MTLPPLQEGRFKNGGLGLNKAPLQDGGCLLRDRFKYGCLTPYCLVRLKGIDCLARVRHVCLYVTSLVLDEIHIGLGKMSFTRPPYLFLYEVTVM